VRWLTAQREVVAPPSFPQRTVVVIADGFVAGRIDAIIGLLGATGTPVVHVIPAGEPTVASVDAAADAVRSVEHPVVVGAGGGSALDTAKLAASVSAADAGVERYLLGATPLPVGPPVVAVPTTSGTGSEVTRTSVLTDASGRKSWAWGDELLPPFVVLDPVLTVTVPPHVTAATGLDAFVHAVEAVTGRRAGGDVAAPAMEAIGLVAQHLPNAVARPDDLDARRALQDAAMLAGVAIDAGGTGIAHSIGHALGTLGHVPHGVAVAAGLRGALEWNLAGSEGSYEPVATALGCVVADVPARVDALLDACRFAEVVRQLGTLQVGAGALAAAMFAEENRPMHDNNCRLAGAEDRLLLAETALRRWSEWSS
jgi:alcohol dehydrogenase class IV